MDLAIETYHVNLFIGNQSQYFLQPDLEDVNFYLSSVMSQQYLVDSTDEIFYCHYLQGMAKNSFLRSLRYAQGFILLHLYQQQLLLLSHDHTVLKNSNRS